MSNRPPAPPSIRELPQRDAERICATHRLPSLGVALQELLLNAVEAGARRVVATLSGGSGAGNSGHNRQNPLPISRACVEDDGHGVRADDLAKLGKWGFSSKGGNGGGSGGGRGVALAALAALAPAAVTFDSLAVNNSNNQKVMRATFGGSSSGASALNPITTTQVGLAPERVQRLWREQQRRPHGSRVAFAPPRSMLSLHQGQNATSSAAASEVARAREALAIAALPFPSVHVELVWRQEQEDDEGDEGGRQQQNQQPELVLEMPSGRSVRDTLAVLFPHAPQLTGVKADGEDGTGARAATTGGGVSGAVSANANANSNNSTKPKLRGYVDNPGTANTSNNKSTIITVDTHCPRLVFVNGRRVCSPPLEAALSRWHACASQRAAKQALALFGGGSSSTASYPMAYALFLTLPVECAGSQQQQQQQMSPALWRLLGPLLRSALRPAWGDPGRDAEALMAAFEQEEQQRQDDGKTRSRRSNKDNSGGLNLSFGGAGGRKRWRGGARSGGGGGVEWAAATAPPAAAAGPVSAPFALPGLTSMHAESRSRVIVSGKQQQEQQQQPNDVPTAAAVLATADLDATPPPPPPQPILTAAELARRLQQSTEALGHRTSGQQQQQQEQAQGPTLPVPAAVVVGGATTATTTRPLTRSDLSRALVVGQAEPSRWLLAVVPPSFQSDNRTALIAIDPHAADERVLLERLQRGLQGQLRRRQRWAGAADDGDNDDNDDHSTIVEVLGPPTRLRPPQALRLTPQERDALRGGGGGGNGNDGSSSPSSVASALHLWGWAWASDDDTSTRSTSSLHLLAVPTVCGTPLTAWDFLGHLSALMAGGGGGDASAAAASSAASVVVPPGAQRALRSKACRSALMFGDALEPQQARGLVEALASSRLWTACAHGRPTAAALMVVVGGGGGAGAGVLPLPRAPLLLPPPHEVLEALEEQRRKRQRMGGGGEEEEAGQQERGGLAERLRAHLARCEEKRRKRAASGGAGAPA